MLTFEHPGWLLLLALLPVVIYIRYFFLPPGALRVSFGSSSGTPPSGSGGISLLLSLTTVFYWIGTALLIISVSGPSLSIQKKVYLNRGTDIIIVLDQSPSMAARDYPPESRLEAAVNIITSFIRSRENDAVGLVGFGEEALLKVPPTTDYQTFLKRLKETRIMELGEGTAIGMGLAVAILHLSRSEAQDKVIVLITDGDNNSGEIQPEAAAAMAAQTGVRLYTIGIGTEGEVPFEYNDPDKGTLVTGTLNSRFNESMLMALAKSGKGRFFNASTPGAFEGVFRSIDSLESREKRMRLQVDTRLLYREFIQLAFFFILGSFIFRKIFLREVL